jgi:hypothetical protein
VPAYKTVNFRNFEIELIQSTCDIAPISATQTENMIILS